MTIQNMTEAYQVPAQHLEANFKDLATWCKGTIVTEGDVTVIKVNTREGVATAKTGDRIIVDADGHYYVQSPTEFLQAFPAAAPPAPERQPVVAAEEQVTE